MVPQKDFMIYFQKKQELILVRQQWLLSTTPVSEAPVLSRPHHTPPIKVLGRFLPSLACTISVVLQEPLPFSHSHSFILHTTNTALLLKLKWGITLPWLSMISRLVHVVLCVSGLLMFLAE